MAAQRSGVSRQGLRSDDDDDSLSYCAPGGKAAIDQPPILPFSTAPPSFLFHFSDLCCSSVLPRSQLPLTLSLFPANSLMHHLFVPLANAELLVYCKSAPQRSALSRTPCFLMTQLAARFAQYLFFFLIAPAAGWIPLSAESVQGAMSNQVMTICAALIVTLRAIVTDSYIYPAFCICKCSHKHRYMNVNINIHERGSFCLCGSEHGCIHVTARSHGAEEGNYRWSFARTVSTLQKIINSCRYGSWQRFLWWGASGQCSASLEV